MTEISTRLAPNWPEPYARAAVHGLQALHSTWRVTLDNSPSGSQNIEAPACIYAIWHGRALALSALLSRAVTWRELAVMVIDGPQGQLPAATLEHFGARVVRGSSWGRGPQALLTMARALRRGASGLIAVDGPAGPAHCARSGAVALAAMTQLPIQPVGVTTAQGWTLPRTWDRHLLPLPGAELHVRFGQTIHVPRRADRRARRDALKALQIAMTSLNDTSAQAI